MKTCNNYRLNFEHPEKGGKKPKEVSDCVEERAWVVQYKEQVGRKQSAALRSEIT